jgi:glycine cleavage system aminomethyltransferase T
MLDLHHMREAGKRMSAMPFGYGSEAQTMRSAASPRPAPTSPLDGVLQRHGATMSIRHGRCVAAHFGSAASEAAVCLRTVGIADRSDRTTFELRGAPLDIDEALTALGRLDGRAWSSRTDARNAIVRCEHGDAPRCAAAVLPAEGTLAVDVSDRYAAIGVVGPLAEDLLRVAEFHDVAGPPVVMRDGHGAFELLIQADGAASVWTRLLEAGAPFRVACVGLDALEHLAASRRSGS